MTSREVLYKRFQRAALVFTSSLAKASVWLFLGNVLAGGLGYVFQILLGRLLDVPEYALFSAIMALFAVFSAPMGTVMMAISRKVSECRAAHETARIARFYREVSVRIALLAVAGLIIWLGFTHVFQQYLRGAQPTHVHLLGVLLVLSLAGVVNNAFLQGLQLFTWLSATAVAGVAFKIILAAGFVSAGWGVTGALSGAAVAALLVFAVTMVPLAPNLSLSVGDAAPVRLSVRSFATILLANSAFAVMTQLDIVLVNHFFSAHDAGIYAAAAVLGKAVLYLPGGIALALFPMVAEEHARRRDTRQLLLQALFLVGSVCTLAALFYFLAGRWLVVLLYGEQYREAGDLLRYYGFAILPMTLVMVTEYFLIAKGKILFAYLFAAVAPLQITAVYLWHESLTLVIGIMAAFGAALVCVGLSLMAVTRESAPAR